MPPEATNGIFSSSATRGSRIMFGMSSSPGWPPHSKPSTLTASQPIRSAVSEWRTEVHLWMTLTPCAFSAGMYCSRVAAGGLDDPDAAFDDRADVFRDRAAPRMTGRKVRLTPNGWSVMSRQRSISLGQILRRRLRQTGDDAEPAGIRHCSRHLGIADVMHAALDDRMLLFRTVQ